MGGENKQLSHKFIKVKYTFQMVAAFLCAFFLVNISSFFYCNPAQAVTNPDRYTTVKHKTRRYNFYGLEGYGITSTDTNGFYNDGNVLPEEAEILCIGSSQTQAFQVDTQENYVSRLNQYNRFYHAYNLGVGGTYMNRNLYRVPFIPSFFTKCKVIIHETPRLPTLKEWDEIIQLLEDEDAPIENQDWKDNNVLFRLYRSIPYFRLIKSQIDSLWRGERSRSNMPLDTELYRSKANYALQLLRNHLNNIPLIIIYLPDLQLDKNGHLIDISDDERKTILQEVCGRHNILFVHDQLSTKLIENYECYRTLPYGFLNSHVGQGHLNAEGHRMVAEVLHKILQEEGIGQ